jgi:hypothetical protein
MKTQSLIAVVIVICLGGVGAAQATVTCTGPNCRLEAPHIASRCVGGNCRNVEVPAAAVSVGLISPSSVSSEAAGPAAVHYTGGGGYGDSRVDNGVLTVEREDS